MSTTIPINSLRMRTRSSIDNPENRLFALMLESPSTLAEKVEQIRLKYQSRQSNPKPIEEEQSGEIYPPTEVDVKGNLLLLNDSSFEEDFKPQSSDLGTPDIPLAKTPSTLTHLDSFSLDLNSPFSSDPSSRSTSSDRIAGACGEQEEEEEEEEDPLHGLDASTIAKLCKVPNERENLNQFLSDITELIQRSPIWNSDALSQAEKEHFLLSKIICLMSQSWPERCRLDGALGLVLMAPPSLTPMLQQLPFRPRKRIPTDSAGEPIFQVKTLRQAILEGDVEKVALLVESRPEALREKVDEIHNTPLHLAASLGHLGMCSLILHDVSNASAVSTLSVGLAYQHTLHCLSGPVENQRENPLTHNDPLPSIITSSEKNNTSEHQHNPVSPTCQMNALGEIPLQMFVKANRHAVTQTAELDSLFYLLSKEVSFESHRSMAGDSVLHSAAMGGCPRLVELCILNRTPTVKNAEGLLPLDLMISNSASKDPAIAQLLWKAEPRTGGVEEERQRIKQLMVQYKATQSADRQKIADWLIGLACEREDLVFHLDSKSDGVKLSEKGEGSSSSSASSSTSSEKGASSKVMEIKAITLDRLSDFLSFAPHRKDIKLLAHVSLANLHIWGGEEAFFGTMWQLLNRLKASSPFPSKRIKGLLLFIRYHVFYLIPANSRGAYQSWLDLLPGIFEKRGGRRARPVPSEVAELVSLLQQLCGEKAISPHLPFLRRLMPDYSSRFSGVCSIHTQAKLCDMDTGLLAQSLTAWVRSLAVSITPHQLVAFARAPSADEAGHRAIRGVIQQYNRLSRWVAVSVLALPNSVGEMVGEVLRFLDIAQHCLSWRDYHSTFAIHSGLHHSALFRLTAVWKQHELAAHPFLAELRALTSVASNYARYRSVLAELPAKTAYQPFLAILLGDLTNIENGLPDELGPRERPSRLLNFHKLRWFHSITQAWERGLSAAYGHIPESTCAQYLASIQACQDMFSDDDLHKVSWQKEQLLFHSSPRKTFHSKRTVIPQETEVDKLLAKSSAVGLWDCVPDFAAMTLESYEPSERRTNRPVGSPSLLTHTFKRLKSEIHLQKIRMD